MLPENERKFDEILKKSLKQHRESIRDDFARELLTKIQIIEQQNAIRKVVLQERISLAAFILLPLATIAAIFAFPDMVAEMGRLLTELPPLIIQALIILAKQWQLLVYYTLIGLGCLYAAYQVLRLEN
ncbi:MAG: hypothetical protein CVV39_07155 [Planctomycetes bacterium HGW-Planctomycetes-1]|nr:MAG: hypothetical protein CVV39_07155 [Planctomycetes bacterium HGW-Planctomycetes-1]